MACFPKSSTCSEGLPALEFWKFGRRIASHLWPLWQTLERRGLLVHEYAGELQGCNLQCDWRHGVFLQHITAPTLGCRVALLGLWHPQEQLQGIELLNWQLCGCIPCKRGSQWVITPCSPYQGWPQGMSGLTCCMCSLWMECLHMSWGLCCATPAGLTSQVATRRLHQQRGWIFFSQKCKKNTQNTRLSASSPTWPCFTARVLNANTWWSPS